MAIFPGTWDDISDQFTAAGPRPPAAWEGEGGEASGWREDVANYQHQRQDRGRRKAANVFLEGHLMFIKECREVFGLEPEQFVHGLWKIPRAPSVNIEGFPGRRQIIMFGHRVKMDCKRMRHFSNIDTSSLHEIQALRNGYRSDIRINAYSPSHRTINRSSTSQPLQRIVVANASRLNSEPLRTNPSNTMPRLKHG
ncbi:hypothetical protein LTS15_000946 [Exophiala xenobiotica]|nr:hypothetical protein LTS15_000946 [Exophiala xenobiotica]